jgi:hypothetical protein
MPTQHLRGEDKEFGSRVGGWLHHAVWCLCIHSSFQGVIRSLRALIHGRPMPSTNPHGGRFGLPADFLIAPDGRVLACKYGSHAYDQWSVDEIIAFSGVKDTDP